MAHTPLPVLGTPCLNGIKAIYGVQQAARLRAIAAAAAARVHLVLLRHRLPNRGTHAGQGGNGVCRSPLFFMVAFAASF